MNNSIRAVSIIALAMSISLVGPDQAMAREKRQTVASTRSPLNFPRRNTSSVRRASNSHIAFKEAWAEFFSTPARMRSRGSSGTGRSSSFTAGEPKTLQCELARLRRMSLSGALKSQVSGAQAHHSSVVAAQTDPRGR